MKRKILDFLRWIAATCGVAVMLTAIGCEPTVDRATAEADVEQDADFDDVPARSPPRPSATAGIMSKTFARSKEEHVATPLPLNFPSTYASDVPSADRVLARPASAAVAAPVPRPQPALATTSSRPAIDVSAAARQADEQARRAVAATTKGAWFTARTDFFAALNTIAAMHDARDPAGRHRDALEAALTAMKEAEDFVVRTSGAGGGATDAASIASGHKTSAFIAPLAPSTAALVARAAYLQFARDRLADAADGNVTASVALHGLGKIHAASGASTVDARGKAQVFYEAALVAGQANFLAANDLAVLLAEEGRLERARDVLHAALRQSPQPAMWTNLASIHDRLGEPQLAELARREAAGLEGQAPSNSAVLPTHNVAWLDPRQFAATSRQASDAPPIPANASGSRPPAAAATPPTPPARWAQRPMNRALAY